MQAAAVAAAAAITSDEILLIPTITTTVEGKIGDAPQFFWRIFSELSRHWLVF